MIKTALASTALFAAHALAHGSAIVINSCSYPVHMSNTPASGGGFNAVNQLLSPGGSYTQSWTELTNGDGWSIKLSPTGNFVSNLMQYEYTYHNDGIIWFDLSDVNGNPWNANWEIQGSGSCVPRQAAYRFSTDDAYGMQSCPSGSSITVTLCTASGGSPPVHHHPHPHPPHKHHHHHKKPVPPPVVPTTTQPAVSAAPETTTAPTSTTAAYTNTYTWGGPPEEKVQDAGGNQKIGASKGHKTPTTFATAKGPAVTVTDMQYETVVQYVTKVAS